MNKIKTRGVIFRLRRDISLFLEGGILRKALSIMFGFCLAFLGFFTFASHVDAATPPNTAGYTVQAELPDNQINKNVSFFDLKVTPNSTQDLKINIYNKDTADHKYRVEVNQAVTNSNGIVDYSLHGLKKDPTLKYNIESMFAKPETVTVSANSSKEVTLTMKTPKGEFDGSILGGIRVMQLDQTDNQNTSGKVLSVKNQYAYVLGIQLQQKTDPVKPDLRLLKGLATRENRNEVIAAQLQNYTPALINQAEVITKITPQGKSNVVLRSDKKNLSFAPNSTFNLGVNAPGQSIGAGKYTMHIKAKGDNGTKEWNMKKNFVITKAQADELNEAAKNSPKAVSNQPKYRLFVALAALVAALLIGLLIWNFKLQRRGRR